MAGYRIDNGTYISGGLIIVDNLEIRIECVKIGKNVSIGPRVTLLPASGYNILKTQFEKYGEIVIEDESWIGEVR